MTNGPACHKPCAAYRDGACSSADELYATLSNLLLHGLLER